MLNLIRLYPDAWRRRYGPELEELLAERTSLRDRIDVIRGALDAHRHGELVRPDGLAARIAVARRVTGLLALAGGLVWVGVSVLGRVVSSGDAGADLAPAVGIAMALMAGGLVGRDLGGLVPRLPRVAAAGALLFAVALVVDWEVKLLLTIPIVALVLGGLLALGGYRAGIGRARPRAFAAGAFALALMTLLPIEMGLLDGLQPVLLAPYGLAWMLVGILIARRGPASGPHPFGPGTGTEASPA
jgi:hypothetical protein